MNYSCGAFKEGPASLNLAPINFSRWSFQTVAPARPPLRHTRFCVYSGLCAYHGGPGLFLAALRLEVPSTRDGERPQVSACSVGVLKPMPRRKFRMEGGVAAAVAVGPWQQRLNELGGGGGAAGVRPVR
jgi:hypothetical protein